MERLDLELLIQEFLEGAPAPEDEARLHAELERSAEARKLMEQYRLLLSTEASAAANRYTAAPEISVKVMDAIEDRSAYKHSWRFFMTGRRVIYAASLCAAAFALLIVQREGSNYRDFMPPPDSLEQAKPVPTVSSPASFPAAPEKSGEAVSAPVPAAPPAAPEPGPVRAEPRKQVATEAVSESTPSLSARSIGALEAEPELKRKEERAALESSLDKVSPLESFGFVDEAYAPTMPPQSGAAGDRENEGDLGAADISSTMFLNEGSAPAASVKTEGISGAGAMKQRAGGAGASDTQFDTMARSTQAKPSRSDEARSYVHVLPDPPSAPKPSVSAYMPPPPPPAVDTEVYGHYQENERVKVSQEPVSTFGIDVDTGSYTNVRRFLAQGKLPPKDAVRIEELLNYFDYDYPKQTDQPFAVYYEIASSPLEPKRTLLKLGIRARDLESTVIPPRSLVFLIDVSGSMADSNKLPLLKQALHVLIDELREQDRLSLVTYADGAQIVIRPAAGSAKAELHNAVERLEAGGSTNGGAGIDLAFDLAQQSKNSEGPTSVVLATDGDFNVGNYSFDGLMRLVEEKRRSGISLNTLGLGAGNLKEQNLEQLADRGNGSYYYLDSYKEARDVLTKKLTGMVHTIARDVKLQVEFNPDHVREYRLIGYDNRRLSREDFSDDSVDSGEIGAGHTVTALYDIVLKSAETDDEKLRYGKSEEPVKAIDGDTGDELAYVKIRFKRNAGSSSEKLEYPVLRDKVQSDGTKASPDFRFAAAVAYFGDALRQSRYFGDVSLKNVAELAKGSLGSDPDGKRAEFQRMAEQVSWLLIQTSARRRNMGE